jgi:hypothetical protein
VACAVLVFAGSFLVASDVTAKVLRAFAFVGVVCSYLVSGCIRISDTYKLWPGTRGTAPEPQYRPRTWRSRAAEYAYLFGVGILGTVIICWLAF